MKKRIYTVFKCSKCARVRRLSQGPTHPPRCATCRGTLVAV